MKNGDEVIVRWKYSNDTERGILLGHTEDWKNVTIRTDRGGEMNGMVGKIEMAPQEYATVYPEAKGVK